METWQVLLEGSLILGVLTAIIGILKDKTDRKLQYITSERKEWRKEVEEIAQRLQRDKTNSEIDNILCQLKVKINTYGIANEDNVFQDAHIWKIIKTLEGLESCENDKEIEKSKRILIKYLSCLLKYNWEVSKMEVIGNHTIIAYAVVSILFFVSIIICCILQLKINVEHINIDDINIYIFVSMLLFTGLLVIDNFVVLYMQIKMSVIQANFVRIIKNKKNFSYIKSFVWLIVYTMLWMIYLFVLFLVKLFELKGIVLFIVCALIYLFVLYCICYFKISYEKENYDNYYETIKKIYILEVCPYNYDKIKKYEKFYFKKNKCNKEDCPNFKYE